MSSIPAVSAPVPAQGCLPSLITYFIDLITSVVSKIFALVGQLFSSIQEGMSRLFGWSATPVPAVNPVPVAAAPADSTSNSTAAPDDARRVEAHREQSRISARSELAEMERRHTAKILQLQAGITAELRAPNAALEAPEKNAKLSAVKAAAIEMYTLAGQAKREAEQALADVRSSQVRAEREPHHVESILLAEDAQLRLSLAVAKLQMATREAIMHIQIATCVLESTFLDPQEELAVIQRMEAARLQSHGARGAAGAESSYTAVLEYFNHYAVGEERCIWTIDHTIDFNTREAKKYRRISELEEQFRSKFRNGPTRGSGSVIASPLLSVIREGLVEADGKLKAALENAQRAVAALRSTQRGASTDQTDHASLYLTSQEALREAQCLDEAILAVEQAYIAILEAGMEGITVCRHLGIAPQFKILSSNVYVPVRFEAASVDKFYGPMLRIAGLHMNDTKACVEIFEQRL